MWSRSFWQAKIVKYLYMTSHCTQGILICYLYLARLLGQSEKVSTAPIIIFEGILSLYDIRIRELMDLKIFVLTDDDIRLARRCKYFPFINTSIKRLFRARKDCRWSAFPVQSLRQEVLWWIYQAHHEVRQHYSPLRQWQHHSHRLHSAKLEIQIGRAFYVSSKTQQVARPVEWGFIDSWAFYEECWRRDCENLKDSRLWNSRLCNWLHWIQEKRQLLWGW